MNQTTCQNCKAANKANAVVCFNCGVKLTHQERRLINQFRHSSFIYRLQTAPQRFAIWLTKKIKLVLTALILLVTLGALAALILGFLPMGWPKYKAIPLGEEGAKELRQTILSLYAKSSDSGQELKLTPNAAVILAETLLYAREIPTGKTFPLVTDPGEEKAFIVVEPKKDDRLIFTVTGKWRDKIPWRLALEVEAMPKNRGAFRVVGFKYGNMRIPQSTFFRLLELHLGEVNPGELLTQQLKRIESGSMSLNHNRDREFLLRLRPAETDAEK